MKRHAEPRRSYELRIVAESIGGLLAAVLLVALWTTAVPA